MGGFKDHLTVEKYIETTVIGLRNAHNSKSMAAVEATFRDADEWLVNEKVSEIGQRQFWASVRKATQSPVGWLFERQANSALVALMQAIQQRIAARERQ